MTDIIEEARAMLAGLRSHPWRRDRDMVQGAGCILVAKCIDADAAGFIAAAPRLLAALADECERLRAENALLLEAMPTDEEIDAIRRQSECAGYVRNDRADMRDAKTIAPWLARLDAAKEVR